VARAEGPQAAAAGVGRLRRLVALAPDHLRTAWWGLVAQRRAREPLVVVQAVVLAEPGVLLTVRRDLRGWELPGGNLVPGEEEEQALVREVAEETGFAVAVERLVGTYRRSGFLPHVARVYRCRLVGGHMAPSHETPRVGFFDPARPPSTLFPWYRTPLADALRELPEPVERREHQGLGAIWAGLRIDLRMRWTDDVAG
jgi:8-oxo-dGTP diphosphatase